MGLLPSLKQRKRYIAFEVLSPKALGMPEIHEEVQNALRRFLGEHGIAQASPRWVRIEGHKIEKHKTERHKMYKENVNGGNGTRENSQRFILKTSHFMTDKVKMALLLCRSIKHVPVIFRSVITSGTIKKAGLYV